MMQHDGVQAGMVLEKELRFLHINPKATGSGLSIYETSKPSSTVTHFLQQGHTYSNKATIPNGVIPTSLSTTIIKMTFNRRINLENQKMGLLVK